MKSSRRGETPSCFHALRPLNPKSLERGAAFTSARSPRAFVIGRFGAQLGAVPGMFTLHDIYITATPRNLLQHPLGPRSVKPARAVLDVARVWFFQYPGQEHGRAPSEGGGVARWHHYTAALAFLSGQPTGAISTEGFCLFVRLFCIFSLR